jgi:hypothetical protein
VGREEVFRQSVVDSGGFNNKDRVPFHMDEAMSWETAHNPDRMPGLVLIIRNPCLQGREPEEVRQDLGPSPPFWPRFYLDMHVHVH